jgi:uncharacterized membrane protein
VKAMSILQGLLGISYPVLIFFALSRLEPRQTAFLVLALAGLRLAVARPKFALSAVREIWLMVALVGLVVAFTAYQNDPLGLLMAPVLMNVALLVTFGGSLRSPRPMVERFARLQVDDLSKEEIRYCRVVTQIWCGFFVINGAICLALALSRDLDLWTFYTGLISYILIGILFSAEYVYRHWRFRRFLGGFADPLLKHLFPPRSSEGRKVLGPVESDEQV